MDHMKLKSKRHRQHQLSLNSSSGKWILQLYWVWHSISLFCMQNHTVFWIQIFNEISKYVVHRNGKSSVAEIIKNLSAFGTPQCLSNCCWVPRFCTEKLRQKKKKKKIKKANSYITRGFKSIFSTADFKKWLKFMRMSLVFYFSFFFNQAFRNINHPNK